MYSSASLAEEALISAWISYEYPPGSGPIAVYLCEDCQSYHLTSKGPMNKKLADYLSGSRFRKDKEANRWLSQLKRKRKL